MTVVAGFSGAPEAPNPDLKEALLPTISASSLNSRVSPSQTQTGQEAQPLSKHEPLLSSVLATRAAETQNPEQSKIQAANHKHQATRELAEWENGKLTGQRVNPKVNTIQVASAEQNQVSQESQTDSSLSNNRSEASLFRFSEPANQVASKTQSPTPNVNSLELFEQIVRKAELLLRQNSSQMKIQLEPEFLGKLTIKVMVEEGVVTARFITESYQVKQMLEANLGSLRQTLESHGMRVERAEVDVQLNNGGLFDGSEGQDKWNWSQQYPLNLAGSSLREGSSYDNEGLPYVQADLVMDENYGILANGGLNFLV
jgi:flagellar hook-length control protein FliK